MDITKITQLLSSIFGESFYDIFDDPDAKTLAPVAAMLGIKPETLCVIIRLIPRLLKGDINIKSVIPSIIPVFLSYMLSLNNSTAAGDEDENTAADECPAADENDNFINLRAVLGENYSGFDVYLQSESASS